MAWDIEVPTRSDRVFEATLSSGGKVTIPKRVLETLAVKGGTGAQVELAVLSARQSEDDQE